MLEWTSNLFAGAGEAGLAALFAAAFVSATVLPANSELVLAAVLKAHPDRTLAALVVATVGNTLGGLTTYGLGRLVPADRVEDNRATRWIRHYGAPALLLSWLPLVGDALCAAAGWLRVPFAPAAAAMALGKAARYALIAQGMALL
jgi:membrane protein YqaA with SNARE-associated domain